MKFYCFLLLLIITFITGCESAISSVTVKLNEPAVLPCSEKCSETVRWILSDNPHDPLAVCDQTSCKVKDGYQMNRHQYLKGDYSLTITKTDFNKRDTYKSRCGLTEMCKVLLQVTAMRSTVRRTVGESLVMKLDVSDPVEVIYSRTEEAGASRDQICTVRGSSLQCKPEYNHRTSLISSDLELRDMKESESGVYIIRDIITKDDIHIYTVIIDARPLPGWVIPLIVVVGVLLVMWLCIVGVWMFRVILLNKEKLKLYENKQKLEIKLEEKQNRQDDLLEQHRDITTNIMYWREETNYLYSDNNKMNKIKLKLKTLQVGEEHLNNIQRDIDYINNKMIPWREEAIKLGDENNTIVKELMKDLKGEISDFNKKIKKRRNNIDEMERILSGKAGMKETLNLIFLPWRSSWRKKQNRVKSFWDEEEKLSLSLRKLENMLSERKTITERLTAINEDKEKTAEIIKRVFSYSEMELQDEEQILKLLLENMEKENHKDTETMESEREKITKRLDRIEDELKRIKIFSYRGKKNQDEEQKLKLLLENMEKENPKDIETMESDCKEITEKLKKIEEELKKLREGSDLWDEEQLLLKKTNNKNMGTEHREKTEKLRRMNEQLERIKEENGPRDYEEGERRRKNWEKVLLEVENKN